MTTPLSIEQKRELIQVARGKQPADLVFKNCQVVNVFSNEILEAEVAVKHERIAGVAPRGSYHGTQEIDVQGQYLVPGLIEAHTHIEDALLVPGEFAVALAPHGTTTSVSDPHEIANVSGVAGLHWMLAAAENIPLRLMFTLPSCIPASPYESAGATLVADDLKALARDPRIASIGEVMNYPGVLDGDDVLLNIIDLARPANATPQGLAVDGHAPEVVGLDLVGYVAAGVESDHESVSEQEGLEKVRLGMWLWVREGSTRNMEALLPIIKEHQPERAGFAADDRTPGDLLYEGDLDYIIRLAVQRGIDPLQAIKMSSLHPAQYFGFKDRGAIAPGYLADILVVPNLNDFRPRQVFVGGKLIAEDGKALFSAPPLPTTWKEAVENTIKLRDFSVKSLSLPGKSGKARVIGLITDQIVTDERFLDITAQNGELQPDPSRDILKIAVVERYGRGRVGVGLLQGLGLRQGAIASSVAHDAHNIIVVGTNDTDMARAVTEIERLQGGLVIVDNDQLVDHLALPIAGIVSPLSAAEVAAIMERLERRIAERGVAITHPFGFLSFLALSVVPKLKITDFGVLDVDAWKIVPVQ